MMACQDTAWLVLGTGRCRPSVLRGLAFAALASNALLAAGALLPGPPTRSLRPGHCLLARCLPHVPVGSQPKQTVGCLIHSLRHLSGCTAHQCMYGTVRRGNQRLTGLRRGPHGVDVWDVGHAGSTFGGGFSGMGVHSIVIPCFVRCAKFVFVDRPRTSGSRRIEMVCNVGKQPLLRLPCPPDPWWCRCLYGRSPVACVPFLFRHFECAVHSWPLSRLLLSARPSPETVKYG